MMVFGCYWNELRRIQLQTVKPSELEESQSPSYIYRTMSQNEKHDQCQQLIQSGGVILDLATVTMSATLKPSLKQHPGPK